MSPGTRSGGWRTRTSPSGCDGECPAAAGLHAADRTGTSENPFRFTGEYQDPTGLYKIGSRYYQPDTGRWIQQDPARQATNPTNPPEASPYLYVGNNPINYRPHRAVQLD